MKYQYGVIQEKNLSRVEIISSQAYEYTLLLLPFNVKFNFLCVLQISVYT